MTIFNFFRPVHRSFFLALLVFFPGFQAQAQQKIPVVNLPLAQEIVKIFPDISQGYVDFSGNGKPDQTADLNEYISESRVRDGQLQVQEILDFLLANWRFISLDKWKALRTAVRAATGPLGDLISIDYSTALDEAVSQREAMGDGLYLTPSAYREAVEKTGSAISSMATAYKTEGGKAEADYTAARDGLFALVDKGLPLPSDLPPEEKNVLSTSMISVVRRDQGANPGRTRTAIRILGLLKSQESAPLLMELAAGSAYPVEAIKALGEIGYRPGISVIASQLRSGASPEIRKAAFVATGAIGGTEALDAVLDIVKPATRESLTPDLLEASTQALAGIAQKGNTDPKILAALKDLSVSNRPMIRRIAASGLGAFNNAVALEALTAMAVGEKDPLVRKVVVSSLGKQTPDAVMTLLLRILAEKDLDSGVKAAAVFMVGTNTGGAKGIPMVVDSLADPNPEVSQEAVAALKKLYPANQAAVIAALSRTLTTTTDENLMLQGVSLLAFLADPTSLASLQAMLSKPIPEVKRIAAWALYRIRSSANPKIVEDLQKLVTNENEALTVRTTAVRALGAIGFDSPQLNLWQTLITTSAMRGEKYSMLRYYAVQALGNILPMKPQTAAALLRTAAKDPDPELRKEAVLSLRKAPGLDPQGEEALAGSFIETKDSELQVRIIETLADQSSSRAKSLGAGLLSGDLGLALKKRVITALAQDPDEVSASAILDAAKDPAASEYITSVMEAFPGKLLNSLVSRRLRTETDKNILAVLNSLSLSAGN